MKSVLIVILFFLSTFTFSQIIEGEVIGIENEMPEKTLVRYFKHYLDQLDKRRNTNWREVFPYLDI